MEAKVAVLLVFAIECAYGAPRVEMVLSASELTVGETLTVECRTFDNALAGGKFLNWYKILPNSEGGNETSRYKIGDNTLMEDPFKSYTAAFKEDGTSVIFILTINVTLEDSGRFGCEVSGNSALQDEKDFTVLVPPSSIEMTADGVAVGDALDLTEDQKLVLVCTVKGSNPAANIQVKVGEQDLTSSFTQRARKVLTPVLKGGKPGLAKISHEVVLTNTAFVVLGSYVGKKLTCSATVPNLKMEPLNKSTAMKMTTKPQFSCNRVMEAFKGQEEYDLKCTITADPPVQSVTWAFSRHIKGENDSFVTVNKQYAQYIVKELVKGESSVTWNTALHIKRVYPQHFRIYRLSATNEQGNSSIDIRLNEIKNPGYSLSAAAGVGGVWSLCTSLILSVITMLST